MINKKILLSLLTVGLLACIASAATWAYFQDTITSTDNKLTTATLISEYTYDSIPTLEGTWTIFPADSGTFASVNVNNLVPDNQPYIIKSMYVHNMGTTNATVKATITPGDPVDSIPGLTIYVGGVPIYTNSAFVHAGAPIILSLGTVQAAGGSSADASLHYVYTSSDDQNGSETRSIPFDMSIVEQATGTAASTTQADATP